ncbi:polysialyltransferase family glycosyltransferase [Thermopolyspora sp. NPDC052614]|uniref:polysialyltransferase family glycosyltransferase n=1 Tax=Thermopolyspora sp. NPDC052614 TaxID=3155682 RepID=UPI00342FBC0F
MIQLCYTSTLFGAMTLAAAIDAGRLGPRPERRILLVSNNAAIPEITYALDETPGFAALRGRFDEIRSWNEIIAPLHPSDWRARIIEVPMIGRLLRSHLGLGDAPDELVVESIAVPPARTIAGLLRDCPITVYADGLMSYGPTRDPLPAEIAGRITRLLHLDLVPGLVPMLLTEYGVPSEPIPDDAFRAVIDQVAGAVPADGPDETADGGVAMILGQYLSALDILTAAEEDALHADLLRGVRARGHASVVFKPHPAAGRGHARRVRRMAEELGVRLTIAADTTPAEVYFAALRPALVAGCFSTALATADRCFGLPTATLGGELILDRLTPYENSNRVPATIVDATVPRLAPDGTLTDPPPIDLPDLVAAVGYCMQSDAHPDLRDLAAAYVEANGPERYFKRRRLWALDLIPPPPAPPPPAPQSAGTLSRLRRRLTARP